MSEPVFLTPEMIETALVHGPSLVGGNGSAPPERDSWTPLDLTTLPDAPPIRPTLGGVGIVYPGKRHVFSGPPESAKTLAAYAIGIHVIRGGGSIILIDFEMGSYDARARIRELGASDDEIRRIHYLEPDEPATAERIEALTRLQTQLVIVDAAAGAYSLEGLDDNKRGDVEKLSHLYVRSFWRAGIASIFVDHVVKDSESRGKFMIGSERKLGGADVHLGFETITPISRGSSGLYKIVTHKDRGGYLRRGHLADLELDSDPETHAIVWTFTTPAETGSAGYFRPTHLMEKVSLDLELRSEPVTRNTVAATLGGTKDYILKAISALVREGFVTETDGPNRSKLLESTRRYRENDPDCNPETEPGGSVVRSGSAVVRRTSEVGGSVVPPPVGGNRTTHDPPQPQFEGRWFGDLQAPFDPVWAEQLRPDEDEP